MTDDIEMETELAGTATAIMGEGGAFRETLKRNNKSIRDARAEGIFEDAEEAYRRHIEDLRKSQRRTVRDQANLLDLSPENAQSLILGKDFDAEGFVSMDMGFGILLRELEIKIEIAVKQYKVLFGMDL